MSKEDHEKHAETMIVKKGDLNIIPQKKWTNADIGANHTIRLHINQEVITITLTPDKPVSLGRSGPGDVKPDVELEHLAGEKGVSRLHAELCLFDNMVHIRDNKSTNGTYVNQRPIMPGSWQIVRDEDEIDLANLHLKIYFE